MEKGLSMSDVPVAGCVPPDAAAGRWARWSGVSGKYLL